LQRILILTQEIGGAGKSFVVREFAEAARNTPTISFGTPPRKIGPDNSRLKKLSMIEHAFELAERALVIRVGRRIADTKSVRLAYLLESTALRSSSARCASRESR
jgi:hypothetical protein